nr:hypothetical protein [Tanacetum cinerariifolium]GEZ25756.1 hypothetical protein [Tanacetum cinerariifolium]
MLSGFFQNQSSTSGTLPSNTIPNPKGEMKAITTKSGVACEGPSIPTPKKTLPKPNITYPSRLNDQKLHEKATNQMEKFFQIFQDLNFDISFADALLLMPKFASTIKSLLTNKDKLFELAKIPLNENFSAILLVRQSRAKAVVAKVNSSSSTPAISSDVAELKEMVRALLLDKKNRSSALATSPTPAPIKAVESNCVTCGGTHSYQNCPATSGNVYQDNINEYVSQAASSNYNQENTYFRPQMVANQIRPPGFPPVQNNRNNFNRGNNFTQNRGGNFNQSAFNQSQLHRPQLNQASAYQAPIPQTQSVSQTDFKRYVKANDAVLRNIQSQGSGTLPGNTVTNPKDDLKGITTRSGVAYNGPTIPTLSKVVKQGTEVTNDQVQTPSPQSTTHVQPPVTQSETLVSEPIAAPISAPMPNLKPSILYPSRRDNE